MRYLPIVIFAFFLSFSSASQAEDMMSALEVVERANLASYYAGDDGSAQARMIIVDAQGKKQMRQFTLLRKDVVDQGEQYFMVFFTKPTDVKGTVFQVMKKVEQDDDRWLYLPALDLVKRISAGDKRTSFVGSHFYYEDVSGRNIDADEHELLVAQSQGDFYVVKATPKQADSAEFAYSIAEIDKATFLPMQVTYFDNKGNKIRAMKVLKTKEIQGITTVVHSKMMSHLDNSYTEMQFRRIKYNVGLPNDVFSERSLRNPPKKWLK